MIYSILMAAATIMPLAACSDDNNTSEQRDWSTMLRLKTSTISHRVAM